MATQESFYSKCHGRGWIPTQIASGAFKHLSSVKSTNSYGPQRGFGDDRRIRIPAAGAEVFWPGSEGGRDEFPQYLAFIM